MKTNLEKVRGKLSKGWILCQKYSCGIPQWYFLKNSKTSKYPRINENVFCDEIMGNVAYRVYGRDKNVEFENVLSGESL